MVLPVPAAVLLARLTCEEREWLGCLAAGLLGPRLAVLRFFGSEARCDWHDESDIDMLR